MPKKIQVIFIVLLCLCVTIFGVSPVLANEQPARQQAGRLLAWNGWNKTVSWFKKVVAPKKTTTTPAVPAKSQVSKPTVVSQPPKVLIKNAVKNTPVAKPLPIVATPVEIIKDTKESLDTFVDTNTSVIKNTNNFIDNYQRPDKIKVQEIGKYELYHEGYSNFTIDGEKLFNNGEVYLRISKYNPIKDDSDDQRYIWKNGTLVPYADFGYLRDMNGSGQKIVASYNDSTEHNYFLDNDGKLTKLPFLNGSYSMNSVDINISGAIVGTLQMAGGGIDSAKSHTFLWQNGVMKDLGTLGGSESHAIAMNDKGQIVGYSKYDDNEQAEPFIWENNKMSMILTPDGSYLNGVVDINNNGLILGHSSTDGKACKTPACIYPVYLKNNEMVNLGKDYKFFDVNNHDEILGITSDYDSVFHTIMSYCMINLSEKVNCKDIVYRISSGHSYGSVVVYIDGKIIKLDDLVLDDNLVFTGSLGINDRGEILAMAFNYEDLHSHLYLVSLPKIISPILKN